MATLFYDRAKIENGRARITPEGYFVADALVGRANNIQEYRAAELGDAFADRDPNSLVRVFRPESEVFAVDSLQTASRLPITLDHPPGVMVDAKNWREFAKGETGEQILRDGEFIRVPIRVTDAGAVNAAASTHKEFSLGYAAEIRAEAGVFNDQVYDAVLSTIRYNHLAACRTARGGPELRITDERPPHVIQPKGNAMLVMIDGLQVDVTNPEVASTAIARLITARDTATGALDEAQNTIAARDATIAERDASISNLTDELGKAKLTPQALRDAAAGYARTQAKAKAIGATLTDEMDEPAMKRAAVVLKVGDAAANYTDEQVSAAFDVLAAGVQVGDANLQDADPLRDAVRDGQPANVADAAAGLAEARKKRFERYGSAHKGKATA